MRLDVAFIEFTLSVQWMSGWCVQRKTGLDVCGPVEHDEHAGREEPGPSSGMKTTTFTTHQNIHCRHQNFQPTLLIHLITLIFLHQ